MEVGRFLGRQSLLECHVNCEGESFKQFHGECMHTARLLPTWLLASQPQLVGCSYRLTVVLLELYLAFWPEYTIILTLNIL
jgi:hypothetical protein